MNDRSREVRHPETPEFELPQESAGEANEGIERTLERAKEIDIGHDEPVASIQLQQKPQIVLDDDGTTQTQSDDAQTVDVGQETEVIEKQWVAKAKYVLSRYSDNPHKQKSELSKVKADYLKTRFNRVVKVEEVG